MFTALRNLNKDGKILLALFTVLIGAVIIAGFTYKLSKTTVQPQNTVQRTTIAQGNDDDTSNDPGLSTAPEASQNQTIASTVNAQCHIHNMLPDVTCTPGAADPRVTQDNIHQTICVSGYTKTVRPSSSYTTSLKIQQIKEYGYSDTNKSDYEEDHLISLELGGAPSDIKNLWPEPGASPNPKDTIENKLHSLVCSGTIQLAEAQRRISTDWTTALIGY